jgi:hypothetical protein
MEIKSITEITVQTKRDAPPCASPITEIISIKKITVQTKEDARPCVSTQKPQNPTPAKKLSKTLA